MPIRLLKLNIIDLRCQHILFLIYISKLNSRKMHKSIWKTRTFCWYAVFHIMIFQVMALKTTINGEKNWRWYFVLIEQQFSMLKPSLSYIIYNAWLFASRQGWKSETLKSADELEQSDGRGFGADKTLALSASKLLTSSIQLRSALNRN